MKDLSFFLFNNSVGAKMKKGIRNFCNDDGSTSTLNQNHGGAGVITPSDLVAPRSVVASNTTAQSPPTTLEEMILRLELEEEFARNSKLNEYYYNDIRGGRMSCVNNSDILRSARNALNQYPRFSLDGKDSMYRSSFKNPEFIDGRNSACCDYGLRERHYKASCLPSTSGCETVIWCEPGVVAKLMGLEAVPVTLSWRKDRSNKKLGSSIKRQNLRRRAERHEVERRLYMDEDSKRNNIVSCSNSSCWTMKSTAVEPAKSGGQWPTRRFI
ncbi:Alpha/beta-Hydrolases superfamily protein isoform 1 [Hibiscus syriacus]|uniref:Alpha/beta-Hydrolases superfamily protein isoform 1 n=1 Tax=Hibiscus syriacus TaxID=106335 RepID=A0A6A3CQJ9_HIBSY|nr:Alpha/beta-Hydrolases superfamily protein isoform 1 [Hibiscus syriacus]